ncbi:Rrf2 family transcriptional regulator [Epibacterium sp. SM1979]|uniref:Rrf2 family transcriptional regulator n=1 Tax=Tritonibacter litoralis TaxID=2662264 RepID=A0A843Y969_9RHOB|nr:Rrf2 family transcriptional regulator [Tritonibacter litoralis]MQQ07790.1 Rrf2 family transcriptional regulator [Tritonibacter litoralis]
MRLTIRTNLAARILMACADNPGRLLKTAEVAEMCNCSTNHAAHVVQRLHIEGFVSTLRGRAGGFTLARPADAISMGAVFRVFEGDIPFAECFDPETNTCPLSGACRLKRYIERALDAFYHELDMVTLRDLVQGNCGLSALLQLKPSMPENCQP